METVTDFIFLSSKIIVVGDCSHEIHRCLPRGKKTIINLDSILKSRGIIFPTKVRLIKAMVFPEVMLELDQKKAEGQRIEAFASWSWRRLLRVP